jgi:hypothetical protein
MPTGSLYTAALIAAVAYLLMIEPEIDFQKLREVALARLP